MRPSKNVHLLARLREQLGPAVSQEVVAKKIGVHPTTIRRIEIGKRTLTRAMAERLGDAFDVDPQCLLENNLEAGLRTRDGKRWTAKVRREIQSRLKRWGDLELEARVAQRGLHAVLLYQYLEISNVIRQLPNPAIQLFRWALLFNVVKGTMLSIQPEDLLTEILHKQYVKRDNPPRLETVIDDVQAILSDVRLIKRIEKTQSKQNKSNDPNREVKLELAGMFGFDDRGLIATKLIDELGSAKFFEMPVSDFIDLVLERCRKEGIQLPIGHFDPFEAIGVYHAECQSHRAKK